MSAMSSEDTTQRSSSGSGRSSSSRPKQQTAPQQLSTIEKSVTHLLVATKQLLETLTQWSRGAATEAEVSDVYVRLGYEFNIACRAFSSIGVDTADLGPVPDLLRSILEETLSQEASQTSLDRFLPRIRDIIINLLHGLKKKQQRLRQRAGSGNGQPSRQTSIASTAALDANAAPVAEDSVARHSSSRSYAQRQASGDLNGPDLPPRSTSVQGGKSSPRREDFSPSNSIHRARDPSRDTLNSDSSSLSSNAMQNIPVIAPYPQEDSMPAQPTPQYGAESAPIPYVNEPTRTSYVEQPAPGPPPPPPPPPPKQQDALAALQRGGELERRASRRFSAYQIQKHLGSTNGIPMIPPAQNSPIPNRGRDTRESMNAVRTRSTYHNRQKSAQRPTVDSSRRERPVDRRISEHPNESTFQDAQQLQQQQPGEDVDSPIVKTPEDKLAPAYPFPATQAKSAIDVGATINGPINEPALLPTPDGKSGEETQQGVLSREPSSRQTLQQSNSQPQFVPETSPQPGKELTLFLQYKSKIKKFVLPDGGDLTIARLQLAFIEKFAWNTHNNGNDLPEIYLQDSVSGIRHELEELNDIKDRSVLVLNIEPLDEVKRHFDDGLGGIRRMIEGLRTAVDDQQSAIQRVSDRQQEAAKEIAVMAAAPVRTTIAPSPAPGSRSTTSPKDTASQLNEVQSLRRDLAVVRQTYTSFVDDVTASMATIRTKAATVKSTAEKERVPSMTANSGRTYVNNGKTTLSDDSEKLVTRVDDLQDTVEDLRKDVVSRGVRPLPRQLESVSKDISAATTALKKLQDFLKREKPVWTKIWEKELQVVCDDRDLLTMQEELCVDLEDDLEKAAATFALVEQATRQQNLQNADAKSGARSTSRTLKPLALDTVADPLKAKDGVLGEVRALQPNHESRLEAIERAEKARQKELEERRGGAFQKELGNFVEEGKLKKTGGAEETERLRKLKDERIRKEVWERQQARAAAREAKEAGTATATATAQPEQGEQSTVENAEREEGVPKDPQEDSALTNGESVSEQVHQGSEELHTGEAQSEQKSEIRSADGTVGDVPSPEVEFVEATSQPPTPSAE
ncbi:hypothetical protein MBLNU459_g6141t1 [Dothideomycetes sp. NU459]